MDDYKKIEKLYAKKYKSTPTKGKKSTGDFLLKNDEKKPVNVKSNNVDKKNYSPNLISADKLLKILSNKTIKLHFIFVNYKKNGPKLKVISDSGLVPVQQLCWSCLTIEAQGNGVIQKSGQLKIKKTQSKKQFMKGFKEAYKTYIRKQRIKLDAIEMKLR